MAFQRPTLTELVDRIQLDFISRLELIGAVLRRAMVYVLSRVLAGAAHLLHGHLEFLGRQIFPDKSEGEFLIRQASVFGMGRTAPTYARAQVSFTATTAGTVVPAGTLLRNAGGFEFAVDSDATVTGTVSGYATAVLPGTASNVTVGVVLTFESPVAGINSAAPVVAVSADGTDEETIDALRVRLLAHLAEPAHGGTSADYIAWAKEVSGVTRVWVEPFGLGPGTVVVRFVRDNDAGPIPDSGEVAAVQTHLNGVSPAHATVTAAAPIDSPLALTLHIVPDNTSTRSAVTAELRDYLVRTASPGSTVLLSALRTTVGSTAGITDYTMTVPAADVTHTAGQLASLGTITWV